MKTISTALKTHLGEQSTSLCSLLKVTRKDGFVFGFTDFDTDIVYQSVTYKANTGHTPSSIVTSSALNVDNLEIETHVDTTTITESDVNAGLWDYANVEIIRVNYQDLTQGAMYLRKGSLGQIKFGRNQVIVELRGLMQTLQQIIGRIYAPSCDADLGDSKCGFNLATAGFTVSGTITSVTSGREFFDSSRSEAVGFFDGGKITFTSGLNNNYQMEVKTFGGGGGAISLQQHMPDTVSIGDGYTMIAGCDKVRETCVNKFNNVINFRGFPDIPGTDRLVSGT